MSGDDPTPGLGLNYPWRLTDDGAQGVIEGLHRTHAAAATAREVAQVSGSQRGILLGELASQGDIRLFQRPHLHTGPNDQRRRRVERV